MLLLTPIVMYNVTKVTKCELIYMKQKPGQTPNSPGEYEERGPKGGKVPSSRVITIEPGDNKLPPTQKPNRVWVRLDLSK